MSAERSTRRGPGRPRKAEGKRTTVIMTSRIPPDLAARVDARAEALGTSRSELIKRALRTMLKAQET